MKKHILLIENKESELNYFTEALEKTRLNFLCSVAKSEEQAIRILNNIVPDLIFMDLNTTGGHVSGFFRNIINAHPAYVILYSTTPGKRITKATPCKVSRCIHLPENIQTMVIMLQHLLS